MSNVSLKDCCDALDRTLISLYLIDIALAGVTMAEILADRGDGQDPAAFALEPSKVICPSQYPGASHE